MPTRIDHATLQAYRHTQYRVFGAIPAVLRIGVPSADLMRLHQAHGAACSAFVTACNPRGQRQSDEHNTLLQQTLIREIAERGLVAIPGIGVDPGGLWPGEPSVLVLHLPREPARALGLRFEQNAIVWCAADAVPQLLLLR